MIGGQQMKLIIAGGRAYTFTPQDFARLDALLPEVDEVVSGGATGADACGEMWAASHGIPVKCFPADWQKHGRAAGPIRNRTMSLYADAVVLFPGGRGTADMARQARAAGLKIYDFRGQQQ